MTLKFVIILQNLIKAYLRKSGKSKYDRKLTELDVETTRIWSRVNGVLGSFYMTPDEVKLARVPKFALCLHETETKSFRRDFVSIISFYSRYLHKTGTKIAQTGLKSSRLLDRVEYVQSGLKFI